MYRLEDGTFSFDSQKPHVSTNSVGCGQCALCRAQKGAEWCTRLVHEGYSHTESICATLTYAPENLPALGSLSRQDFQRFKWRLRRFLGYRGLGAVVIDGVGEYSPTVLRPHYHVCIYGWWPQDAKLWKRSRAGNPEFISEDLTKLWSHGHVTFQRFSDGAASYCAGHQAWKLTGDKALERLAVRGAAGELLGQREPEFHAPPGQHGLGSDFFDRYGRQMLTHGFTVVGTRKVPVPKYYLRLAEKIPEYADLLSDLKAQRELQGVIAAPNSTEFRLAVREECQRERVRRSERRAIEGW